MTAKVICMASAKGGAGKTILTATFGSFLGAIGKKVLLVDTDASTNGLTLLHLKEVLVHRELVLQRGEEPCGVYELTADGHEPDVVALANGNKLLPALYGFGNSETRDSVAQATVLSKVIRTLRQNYDYIILDAQAGSDAFAQISMRRDISDEVVIVSEYDPVSAAGVERLKALFRDDLTYARTWVLLNKMLPEFVKSFSDFLEIARYLSPIPWDADVVRAYARRRVALDIHRGNEYTFAVLQTIRSLLGDEVSKEIEAWSSDNAAAIRQPLDGVARDLEREFEGIVQEATKIRKRRRDMKLIQSIMLSLIISGGVLFVIWILVKGEVLFGGRMTTYAGGIGAGVVGVMVSLAQTILNRAPDESPDEARLRRQRAVIEEKLHKIESLRHADLETLVRSRKEVL